MQQRDHQCEDLYETFQGIKMLVSLLEGIELSLTGQYKSGNTQAENAVIEMGPTLESLIEAQTQQDWILVLLISVPLWFSKQWLNQLLEVSNRAGAGPHILAPSTNLENSPVFVPFTDSYNEFSFQKQQKYPDVLLVNAWFNLWPQTMQTMALSPFIRFELRGSHWKERMEHLYMLNDLDPRRIVTCERISHFELRQIFAMTDLGVFPNRCEGGTTLMLMEYMACGRPVIASLTSGHTDILGERNCLPLTNLRPFHLRDPDGQLLALWEQPTLDELIERMDHAYHHRQGLHTLARRAAEDMREFTWAMTARRFLDVVLN